MTREIRILAAARRFSDRGWQEDVEEFVRPVVDDALRSAGLYDAKWPDFTVTASSDYWDGVAYSEQPVGEVLGTHYKTSLKVSDDGLQAFALAAAAIESGETDTAIVLAHCLPSKHLEPGLVLDRGVEPFWQRSLGLRATDMEALVRSYWMSSSGWSEDDLKGWRRLAWTRSISGRQRDVLRRGQEDAGRGMSGGPLLLDGAVAIIIGSSDRFPQAAVRLDGMHLASAATGIGEAPVGGPFAFARAARTALDEAGVAPDDIDLFELSDLFDYQAPTWMAALTGKDDWHQRLCGREHGRLGRQAVNLSGGLSFGATPIVAGLDRLAECFAQLTGTAGTSAGTDIGRVLAHGCAGVGAVSHTVSVLSRVDGGHN